MINIENMIKCYNAIMELSLAPEFKDVIKHQHRALLNMEEHSVSKVSVPNYLISAKRGGGITTLVRLLTEYLYAGRVIDFCGTAKSFEFELDYNPPHMFFSELGRLDSTLASYAGFNRFFKGVVCLNIEKWVDHIEGDYFFSLMDYISTNADKLLVVFSVHTEVEDVIDRVEAKIASHLRVESLKLRFPDSRELLDLIETRYLISNGFTLSKDAKALVLKIIAELTVSKSFRGYRTISQLAEDILFSMLKSDDYSSMKITAKMLTCHGIDTTYSRRAKAQGGSKKIIGFMERSV